jgi:hypothetical protein
LYDFLRFFYIFAQNWKYLANNEKEFPYTDS